MDGSLSRYLDKDDNTIFNIKMQVTYPSHHRWQRDVSVDPFLHFSPRTSGKIRTALELLESAHVSYTIEPLSMTFLDSFIPLYTLQIGSKENAIVHDVYGNTLGKKDAPFPYYCLSLFEQGTFIGGTIFSLRPEQISFAYRTFNPTWKQAALKITPAYIGEYATADFASKQGLKGISHGKDRNPYGLNAAIGLATFKLSIGCQPCVPEDSEIHTLETNTLTQDALILELPPLGEHKIKKAYLVTQREHEHKYLQVTKYPDLLQVEVLYRD